MHYTTNMDEGDIKFVYDHCYCMWWLGQVQDSLTNNQHPTLANRISMQRRCRTCNGLGQIAPLPLWR